MNNPRILPNSIWVPFKARRFRNAAVAWVNNDDPRISQWKERAAYSGITLEQLILDEFGFGVPVPDDSDDDFCSQTRIFFADRYGASGLVEHGGSGRCGTRLGVQVKGIGITPLVGQGADWYHSHGFAWLEECLREAVFTALFNARLPIGSVPCLAVIDTGSFADKRNKRGRRALLLRPFALRLSHLQRATFFRPVGQIGNIAQVHDAARVRDVFRWIQEEPGSTRAALLTAFTAIGMQSAACQAYRFANGGFFSSCFTLDGTMIDFGSSTVLPDWCEYRSSDMAPPFGSERSTIGSIAQSLEFFLSKFIPEDPGVSSDSLIAAYDRGFAQHMIDITLSVLGAQISTSAALAVASSIAQSIQARVTRPPNTPRSRNVDRPEWFLGLDANSIAVIRCLSEYRGPSREQVSEVAQTLADKFAEGKACAEDVAALMDAPWNARSAL